MKKVLLIFILVFLLPSCNRDHGGGSDTSFRAKPNTLTKFGSSGTSYKTNLDPGGTYAIIYNGPINGVNYVGIALSDNPDPEATEGYNLKIYFRAPSIPAAGTSVALTAAGDELKIIYYNGTVTTDITADLTLNFISTTTTGNYTTYTITGSGAGSLNTITNIVAVKVGT